MATTTATSRLVSPLTSAVNASTDARGRGAWSRIGILASARNAPARSASADPAMIAARVANGPAVALTAGSRAAGRRHAATIVRVIAASHSTTGSQSRDDVILADTRTRSGATVRMATRS